MPSTLSTPYQWADSLLGVANTALAATEGGSIDRAFVAAGLPALDCCPQLTVHSAGRGLLPTSSPGALTAGHKGAQVAQLRFVRYIITVVRCAPVPGAKGAPPTPAEQAAIAATINQDPDAIVFAVKEAWKAGDLFGGVCRELFYDGATSLDPAGGCVGWLIGYRAAIEGITSLA